MKRIVQAHRLHHAVESKHGTVSFGFLWAPRPRHPEGAAEGSRRLDPDQREPGLTGPAQAHIGTHGAV
jgi:beta-carotene 3-hydroxylase